MTEKQMTRDEFVRTATTYEDARDKILDFFGRNGGEFSNGRYNISFFLDEEWSFEPGNEEDPGGSLSIFWEDGRNSSYATYAVNSAPNFTMFNICGMDGDGSEDESLVVLDNAKFVAAEEEG